MPVDTGFIVFNRRTYPGFCALLDRLDIEPQNSDMSFSMSNLVTGVEYRATTLNTLFAQRRNALRPSFLQMTRDLLRFNEVAPRALEPDFEAATLGAFLDRFGFGEAFRRDYLLPMGAAIWSTSPGRMLEFPVRFFVEFFANHGLLTVDDQPQWLTVPGGSRTYVRALAAPFRDRVRTGHSVTSVRRRGTEVVVDGKGFGPTTFDHVVLAVHSDQALRLLADPTAAETEILSALPYQENTAILHSDESFLPRSRRARASWNYRFDPERADRATLTYDLTRLQSLPGRERMLLTLNPKPEEEPASIHGRYRYSHPGYTVASAAAQARWEEISGRGQVHFCGAYWGYGFHEDGLQSGWRAAKTILERVTA